MKTIWSVAVLGLCFPLLHGCSGEQAVLEEQQADLKATNGVQLNGMKLNGMKLNGMKLNGMKLNGMKLNGTSFGSLSGTSLSSVTLDKTTFRGRLSDGRTISGMDFLGTTMTGILSSGASVTIGIQQIATTTDPEILHYLLKGLTSTGWVNVCDGTGMAVPLSGVWLDSGRKLASTDQFTFACTASGALGKCVSLGYKPWYNSNHHQACTRMLRADYCGTGVSYTKDGNVVDLFDSLGIQKDDHSYYTDYYWLFDAEWGPDGATCIWAFRPDAPALACSRPIYCDSSSRFATGVLIKNWIGVPKGTSYTSSTTRGSGYDISNININIYP